MRRSNVWGALLPPVLAALILAGLAALAASAAPSAAHEEGSRGPALVLLVRHAEKAAGPAGDPALSEAGTRRAAALAAALENAGVTAIVTTQLRRTKETAAPLAAKLGLTPEVVPAGGDADAHAAAVAAAVRRHAGGVVLVVGHSNTVPAIAAALGAPRLPDFCEALYANFFTLVPGEGKSRLVLSRYGAADPDPATACR
jgi:phosphohistidine phosphatase SixA